jgi:inhibitor of cysteine peptidase
MKTYTLFAALLAALALLVVSGCSPIASAASLGDKAPKNLDGTSWSLVTLNGKDLIPQTEITLTLDGDQLSGTAGCNRYFGSVTIENGAPSAGGVGSTQMWCGTYEGVMDQETDYLQALGTAVRYDVEDGQLILFDADGQALLVFAPEAEPIEDESAIDNGSVDNDVSIDDNGDAVETETEKANVTFDQIELLVMESFPVQVAAIVRGNLLNGCVVLDGISATRTDEGFVIEVESHKEGDFCTAALVPFEKRVTLDVLGLPAGTYAVRAGGVSSEFTLSVDNGPVDNLPVDTPQVDDRPSAGRPDAPIGERGEYALDLRGTVTGVEIGADGLQVELTDGESVYSVTISVMQAEVFGRWEEIEPGAELVVSGPMIPNMEPTLVVAEKVVVVGSDSDYVSNLHGTVTSVVPDAAGLQAEIRADDGTDYRVTFDPKTTELVYLGEESELQAGTSVLVSGELFWLMETRIAADVAVVQPAPHL